MKPGSKRLPENYPLTFYGDLYEVIIPLSAGRSATEQDAGTTDGPKVHFNVRYDLHLRQRFVPNKGIAFESDRQI